MMEKPYHSLIRLFPPAISSYAKDVDILFFVLCTISLIFVTLIAGCIWYFAIKYRRSVRPEPPPKTPQSVFLECVWILVPLSITLTLFVWGAKLFLFSFSQPPKDSYEVFVVAKQWMWKFEHPSGRREINELHVPLGRPVRLIMISQDVIHGMFLPALRIKHDVLPAKYSSLWFQATREGPYHLFCAQYCGTKHSQMTGVLTVLKPEVFNDWLSSTQGMDSPASKGRALLTVLGCRSCHRKDSLASAPQLERLYGRKVILNDGALVVADADYIRRSILLPASQVVAHYEPVMPSYQGRVTEEEILQLIAYFKSESEAPKGEPNE